MPWPNKKNLRKQLNQMACLRLIRVKDVVLHCAPHLMSFRRLRQRFKAPRGCNSLWTQIHQSMALFLLLICMIPGGCGLCVKTTTSWFLLLTRCTINLWMTHNGQLSRVWKLRKKDAWWFLQGWQSRIPFQGKVFICRLPIRDLPMGTVLCHRRIASASFALPVSKVRLEVDRNKVLHK